ncbi:MAG: hypothetical protein IBJ13_09590 [Sphingopyxis sp.]|nr:hypothetical protein [Sphingopyxis sp.]
MALASAALLLFAAASGEVVGKSPFRDMATVHMLMTKLQLQDPPHIDQYCGEMVLIVEIDLPPDRPVRNVRINGPECAARRIENLRTAILQAPRNSFVPVKRATRYRFKMRFELSHDAV